ncbi:MAG: glycosyltransferase, partial [Syntrophales bacterium LBB04]|nr:glycosyltransferase [Syntrophales bacterium LBB04]
MLNRCLEALQSQERCGFTYTIVIVDNDKDRAASEIVREWQQRSNVPICYDVEPEQNISLARNKAITNSQGNLIAFIDDDEFPDPTWLLKLFEAYKKFSVDGVLGPVVPFYEGTPPAWLVKSGLCVRSSFQTGTNLTNPRYMRAGNVLFSRDIIETGQLLFDPRLGHTGGEDADFLGRMVKKGCHFIW